jgi:hypothetical protein
MNRNECRVPLVSKETEDDVAPLQKVGILLGSGGFEPEAGESKALAIITKINDRNLERRGTSRAVHTAAFEELNVRIARRDGQRDLALNRATEEVGAGVGVRERSFDRFAIP